MKIFLYKQELLFCQGDGYNVAKGIRLSDKKAFSFKQE